MVGPGFRTGIEKKISVFQEATHSMSFSTLSFSPFIWGIKQHPSILCLQYPAAHPALALNLVVCRPRPLKPVPHPLHKTTTVTPFVFVHMSSNVSDYLQFIWWTGVLLILLKLIRKLSVHQKNCRESVTYLHSSTMLFFFAPMLFSKARTLHSKSSNLCVKKIRFLIPKKTSPPKKSF
jgi:hypothetical protein